MFKPQYVCIGTLAIVMVAAICGVAGQAPANKTVVTIEADKTGEPISKYIYGQFIEHLGRCIYGGIWAEMLEDRKFYYPVPAEGRIWKEHEGAGVLAASPWQVIGPKDSVKMVRLNSYVGEHTPEIRLPGDGRACGIFQDGLGLVKGKEYSGRVVLIAGAEALPIQVNLVWGEGPDERDSVTINADMSGDYVHTPFALHFESAASTDNGHLEIVSRGKGTFQIGTVSLMPADNVKGMRADTLKLLKELNASLYRWPGGNFVSGYDWRDGVGERDKRPPRKNPAWTGVEHNDFGLDEFIVFCREVGAKPQIVVNSGFGDDHSAAEEVEYANGSADTPMGKWRAENGHPEPYNVKWWGIGNEMYGKWQLGYMKLEHYVQKHNLFARAMRKVDPAIKLVAVGDTGKWSRGMLAGCADYMELISEHFYRGERESVIEHVHQTVDAIGSKVEAHRSYREKFESLKGKDIRIALDEWNYWHRPYVYEYGELGCRYTLKDALGIATGLHEMIRNSDMIYMANYAQTVNVIGCIKTTKTEAAFATTGLALKLYRNHFGIVPLAVSGSLEPVDVVAAWTENQGSLTVAVVNPTSDEYEIKLDVRGARLSGAGRRWVIAGSDPEAYNEPGKEPKVAIKEVPLADLRTYSLLDEPAKVLMDLSVQPLSISLCEFAAR
ncbi:MAG: alpha-L-arabinofuranosidase C-terminal domain-containing protein [Planctomycetota bacterium]|jgi:alpha-N-arabinofuranosidase